MYEYRARLARVVDGDTVDLIVDVGFHHTAKLRFRLLGIDTPELNDTDPERRELGKRAKHYVTGALMHEDEWPLVVKTHKADSFGRWLAQVFFRDGNGNLVDLQEQMLHEGIAVPYEK